MWNSGKRPFRQRVVAVAFGVLLGTVTASAQAAEVAGELISASGPVEVRPLGGDVWRAATLRTVLHSGDMVRTGVGGAAEVALVQGVFRMAENTVIILPLPRAAVPAAAGSATGIRLLLYRGRALFHILKDRLEGSFDVITPSVIVGVKGTTFGIEEGATAGVVVFDGSVQAVPTGRPATPPLIVGAGQFTVLVQGELTPPQLYRPGAPGAMWGGGPTRTNGAPLVSPPVGPAATGGDGTAEEVKIGAASAAALAQVGGAPLLSALALHTPAPPRLAAAGGPPGSTGVSPTTHLGGRALSRAASGGRDDGEDDRGRGGGGEGRGRGRDHGRGRCRGRGC